MTIQDIFISNAVETFAFLSKRVFEEKIVGFPSSMKNLTGQN